MISLRIRRWRQGKGNTARGFRLLALIGAYVIAFAVVPFALFPMLPRMQSATGTNFTADQVPHWDGSQLTGGTIYDNGAAVGIGTWRPGATLTVHAEKSFDFAALSGGDTFVNDIHLGIIQSPGFGSVGMCTMGACFAANGTSMNFGLINGRDSMWNPMILSAQGSLLVAGGYNSGSDVRMKKDVGVVGDRWSDILKLRPVTFRWKDAKMDADMHFGLIAQEVQPWFPELVHDMGGDHMLSIEYTGLISLLIDAAKHLAARDDNLGKQVDALARNISDLAAENELLKARIASIEGALRSSSYQGDCGGPKGSASLYISRMTDQYRGE